MRRTFRHLRNCKIVFLMNNPKLKLQAFLSLFCDWVESWLKSEPNRELLQIAHAQIGRVYAKIGKELKVR
jgi:hypothetical protein